MPGARWQRAPSAFRRSIARPGRTRGSPGPGATAPPGGRVLLPVSPRAPLSSTPQRCYVPPLHITPYSPPLHITPMPSVPLNSPPLYITIYPYTIHPCTLIPYVSPYYNILLMQPRPQTSPPYITLRYNPALCITSTNSSPTRYLRPYTIPLYSPPLCITPPYSPVPPHTISLYSPPQHITPPVQSTTSVSYPRTQHSLCITSCIEPTPHISHPLYSPPYTAQNLYTPPEHFNTRSVPYMGTWSPGQVWDIVAQHIWHGTARA